MSLCPGVRAPAVNFGGRQLERKMKMADFFAAAGDLLLTGQSTEGVSPQRVFRALFWYDRGEASFDGQHWLFKVYTPDEQARVDAERAALA